ncbi:hypothetical protein N752_30375 [Desulforamulus aquiferis]|nr:hypothetical protein N752_30375 [Desulforamulus aquiferis]
MRLVYKHGKNQRLDIVTPEKVVFSEEIDFIVAPGSVGELGILPEHAPLVTSLKVGVMRYNRAASSLRWPSAVVHGS